MNLDDVAPDELEIPTANLSLAAFGTDVMKDLILRATMVSLPEGMELVAPRRVPRWAYFLESGLASVHAHDRDGLHLEIGKIGREGIIGGQTLLTGNATRTSTIMISDGFAYRIPIDVLRGHLQAPSSLLTSLHAFTYVFLEQSMQLAFCNHHHEVQERLARWLLLASDFTGLFVLEFRHAFLAQSLGVTRSAITIAAGDLQRERSIRYNRGEIEILDRKKLRASACECQGIIHDVYEQVYPKLF